MSERFVLDDDGLIHLGQHIIEPGAFVHRAENLRIYEEERRTACDYVRMVLERFYSQELAVRPHNVGGLSQTHMHMDSMRCQPDLDLIFRPDGLVMATVKIYNDVTLEWDDTDIGDAINVPNKIKPKGPPHKTQAVVHPDNRVAVVNALQDCGWRLISQGP